MTSISQSHSGITMKIVVLFNQELQSESSNWPAKVNLATSANHMHRYKCEDKSNYSSNKVQQFETIVGSISGDLALRQTIFMMVSNLSTDKDFFTQESKFFL